MTAARLALLLLLLCVAFAAAQTPLTLLSEAEAESLQARCLDGSPRGYYLDKKADETRWFIFLQGGGYCGTKSTCEQRAKTSLGSSKDWDKSMTLDNMQKQDTTINPRFASWNQVFIPYCNGDVHTGRANASSETWGLYFTGHTGLKGLLDHLDATSDLSSATEIVLSGCSAGGIGTFMNADYVAQRYSRARVVGVPVAGWFLDIAPYSSQTPPINLTAQVGYKLWDARVPPACASALGDKAWACLSAEVAYAHIKSPLYIVEAQLDTNQLYTQDGVPSGYNSQTCPYIAGFQHAMVTSLAQVTAFDGLFNPSCFQHCVHPYDVTINGVNYNSSLVAWYDGQTGQHFQDKCSGNISCNDKCQTPGSLACPPYSG